MKQRAETTTTIDDMRARVAEICTALPEAKASSRTGQHTAFEVRGKRFAYFLFDHQGDGRVAINVKAALGVRDALVEADAQRFFVPSYLGPKGWVGLDLGVGELDWDDVADLLMESYCLIAPKRLAAEVGARRRRASNT